MRPRPFSKSITGNARVLSCPAYGSSSLADLTPSLAAAIGVPGFDNVLGIPPADSAVLLLIDGLGAELLAAHADVAPVLAELAADRVLDAGFPASTSISLASIGTGVPPGAHGLVGLALPYEGRKLDTLGWTIGGVDAREQAVPEQVQPQPTVFERVEAAGRPVHVISARMFAGSGLTRAALRGGTYRGTIAHGDTAAAVLEAAQQPGGLAYAYVSELDTLGHVFGPGSAPWVLQLREMDRLVEAIVERLPRGALLAVTGDHGMVEMDVQQTIDYDAEPDLQHGIDLVTGEPRARYLTTARGAAPHVLATWSERLGPQFWVGTADEVVQSGWLGPEVTADARSRLGDVVVLAANRGGVVRRETESLLSSLRGHHGSLTDSERRVPLALSL